MDRRPDRQLLVFALVLLGVSGLFAGRTPGSERLESAIDEALTPLQSTLTRAGQRLTGLVGDAQSLQELRERTAALESENASLETEMLKLVDLKRENRALRDLLHWSRQRVDLDLVGASLVGRKSAEDPGNVRHMIRLDVGRAQGVEPSMPVADDRGLIGQVLEVSSNWCAVLLITDPNSRVEGRIQRSGATGMIFGTPTGELVMRYIPQNQADAEPEVQVGDVVYTSGLSQRFPPMVLIGQVTDVHQSDVETHQEALIRPTVNFNALELALVVRDWKPALTEPEDGER